jgi:hypothetical protein
VVVVVPNSAGNRSLCGRIDRVADHEASATCDEARSADRNPP